MGRKKEIFWIAYYKDKGHKLSNIRKGGQGGPGSGGGKIKYYITYEECRTWINKNYPNILTRIEYNKLKSKFPENIPKSPQDVFHKKGWQGWEHFLNKMKKGYKSNSHKKTILEYDDAKKFLKTHASNLSSLSQYRKYIIENKIDFLPYKPEKTYKRRGVLWISNEDFLPNYNKNFSKKKFLNFNEAKIWIQQNRKDIISSTVYFKEKTQNNLPCFLPYKPSKTYKQEWKGWLDYLGTTKQFVDFKTAKKIMKKNNITSNVQFRQFWKKNKNIIPSNPDEKYEEWINWYDFLGK